LTLHAGAEAAGPYNLSITATDTEVNSSAAAYTTIAVTVLEQADAPNLSVTSQTLSVNEGGAWWHGHDLGWQKGLIFSRSQLGKLAGV
jgi:hypothetical protein